MKKWTGQDKEQTNFNVRIQGKEEEEEKWLEIINGERKRKTNKQTKSRVQ